MSTTTSTELRTTLLEAEMFHVETLVNQTLKRDITSTRKMRQIVDEMGNVFPGYFQAHFVAGKHQCEGQVYTPRFELRMTDGVSGML